jgi:hypothetical protein
MSFSMHRSRLSFLVFAIALLSSCLGCKENEVVLPEAPSGTKTIGTELDEIGTAILGLSSGNFLVAASREGSGNIWEAVLMELDAEGELIREEVIPSSGLSSVVRSIKPRAAGGYLVSGMREIDSGTKEGFVRILNADWSLVEEYKATISVSSGYYGYEATASYAEAFEMPDGSIVLHLVHGVSVSLMRFDPNGTLAAVRYLSSDSNRFYFASREFMQDPTGQLWHARFTLNYEHAELSLSRIDPSSLFPDLSFQFILDAIIDGSQGYYNLGVGDATFLPDGQIMVTGISTAASQYLFKIDPVAGILTWGEDYDISDDFMVLGLAPDGGLRVAAQTPPNTYYSGVSVNTNILAVKTDSAGGAMNRRSYGGPNPERLGGMAIGQDGKMVLIGSTSSYGAGGHDIFLIFHD